MPGARDIVFVLMYLLYVKEVIFLPRENPMLKKTNWNIPIRNGINKTFIDSIEKAKLVLMASTDKAKLSNIASFKSIFDELSISILVDFLIISILFLRTL